MARKKKKDFIQKAIKHPGIEKRAAKKAGMSTHAYMEKEKHAPGKAGERARFGLELEGMHPKGKPVRREEDTHHSVETDEKGKEHHRVHHVVRTTYEDPPPKKSPMADLIRARGF